MFLSENGNHTRTVITIGCVSLCCRKLQTLFRALLGEFRLSRRFYWWLTIQFLTFRSVHFNSDSSTRPSFLSVWQQDYTSLAQAQWHTSPDGQTLYCLCRGRDERGASLERGRTCTHDRCLGRRDRNNLRWLMLHLYILNVQEYLLATKPRTLIYCIITCGGRFVQLDPGSGYYCCHKSPQ